jgi:hypothetical protein
MIFTMEDTVYWLDSSPERGSSTVPVTMKFLVYQTGYTTKGLILNFNRLTQWSIYGTLTPLEGLQEWNIV